MTVGVYKRFRSWQARTKNGRLLFQNEKDFTLEYIERLKPGLVVQLEGRSLLPHYPKESVYYHVSEEANSASCGYTVEAEQGFLPFPDKSVDLLLVCHALEFYQAQQQAVAEMERVLSDNGRVMLFLFMKRFFEEGVSSLLQQPLGKLEAIPMSVRKLKTLLEQEGLEIVTISALTGDISFSLNERFSEYFIQPTAFEIVRKEVAVNWDGAMGALHE